MNGSETKSPRIGRRAVLAAVVGVFASAPWFSFRSTGAHFEAHALANRIVKLLGLTSGVNEMNRSFFNDDRRLPKLIGELLDENPEYLKRLALLSDADLRRRIRHNIVSDFEAGRLSSVDGWILSRTETRALNLRDHLRGFADA